MADYESLIRARLAGDAPLLAILTGGIYAAAAVGRDGISREKAATAAAFNQTPPNYALKPCALVTAWERVYTDDIQDIDLGNVSFRQRVRVQFYEDVGYANIEAAMDRAFTLLWGYAFAEGFPTELIGQSPRQRDQGALKGASMQTVDYLIVGVKGS